MSTVSQLVRSKARPKSKPLMQVSVFYAHVLYTTPYHWYSHIIKNTLCLNRSDIIYWWHKYEPHILKDRKKVWFTVRYSPTWAYPNQDFFSFLFLMRDVELYIWPCKTTKVSSSNSFIINNLWKLTYMDEWHLTRMFHFDFQRNNIKLRWHSKSKKQTEDNSV